MQQARLDAQVRNKSGKGVARSLRRDGKVPAVLYGREKGTLSLQIDDRTFQTLLRNYGSNVLVDLALPGNEIETVIIKSLQRHPVKRNVLHADFQRISLEEKITTSVVIEAVGTPIGVRDGGVLTLTRRQISVIVCHSTHQILYKSMSKDLILEIVSEFQTLSSTMRNWRFWRAQ